MALMGRGQILASHMNSLLQISFKGKSKTTENSKHFFCVSWMVGYIIPSGLNVLLQVPNHFSVFKKSFCPGFWSLARSQCGSLLGMLMVCSYPHQQLHQLYIPSLYNQSIVFGVHQLYIPPECFDAPAIHIYHLYMANL